MNAKQDWNVSAGFFDPEKACVCNDGIRHTFTLNVGTDMPAEQWEHLNYHFLKSALLEAHQIILGPDNRPYLQVYVPTSEEIKQMTFDGEVQINSGLSAKTTPTDQKRLTYKNFAAICKQAVANGAGVALYSALDQAHPNMTIRFGALYAFLAFGDVCGPPQVADNFIRAVTINPQAPRMAIVDQTDTSYTEGEPSDAFFSQYLRDCIALDLKRLTNNQSMDVEFLVREQHMYVMRHMLMLQTSEPLLNPDKILPSLTWYMPILLPLAYKAVGQGICVYS